MKMGYLKNLLLVPALFFSCSFLLSSTAHTNALIDKNAPSLPAQVKNTGTSASLTTAPKATLLPTPAPTHPKETISPVVPAHPQTTASTTTQTISQKISPTQITSHVTTAPTTPAAHSALETTKKSSTPTTGNSPVTKPTPAAPATSPSTTTTTPTHPTTPSSTKTANSLVASQPPASITPSSHPASVTTVTSTVTIPATKPLSSIPSTPTVVASTATSTDPLAPIKTGITYNFSNISLTEMHDQTGIHIYSGVFSSTNQTDYLVMMPLYIYNQVLQISQTSPYPAYNPSTPVLLMPGQKINKTYTIPVPPSTTSTTSTTPTTQTQPVTCAVSLLTGNCYTFTGGFFPQQGPVGLTTGSSPKTTFVNPGQLTLVSNSSLANAQGPITNFFATYVQYPNFSGRLSKPLANNIDNAIVAFNKASQTANAGNLSSVPLTVAAAVPLSSIPTVQPAASTSTTTTKPSPPAPLATYKLANISLTELADPSGIYVYAGTFSNNFPENYGYRGLDYFVMTTEYLFKSIQDSSTYPSYSYLDPVQPLLMPGQQITTTYPMPVAPPTTPTGTATTNTSTPTPLPTANQPVTIAISLVSGNCYQLMMDGIKTYAGNPALSTTAANPSISLLPLPIPPVPGSSTTGSTSTTNTASAPSSYQTIPNFYGYYAPYQNFSGPLFPALTSIIQAFLAAQVTSEQTALIEQQNESLAPASPDTPPTLDTIPNLPSSDTPPAGTNSPIPNTFGNNSNNSLTGYNNSTTSGDSSFLGDSGFSNSSSSGFGGGNSSFSGGGGFSGSSGSSFEGGDSSFSEGSGFSDSPSSSFGDGSDNFGGSSFSTGSGSFGGSSFSGGDGFSDSPSSGFGQDGSGFGASGTGGLPSSPMPNNSFNQQAPAQPNEDRESENSSQKKEMIITTGEGSPLLFN